MIRQRIGLRGFGIGELLLRLLVSLLAVALIFYGVMVVLAALKLDPKTINDISAYRTVRTDLTSITAGQITGRDRIIVAVAGLLSLMIFGPLAWRALPRPYLTRARFDAVQEAGTGRTQVAPRALERVAELAATADPRVSRARARYGDGAVDVTVQLTGTAAGTLIPTLTQVQDRVRDGLGEHGLPDNFIVDITFDGDVS